MFRNCECFQLIFVKYLIPFGPLLSCCWNLTSFLKNLRAPLHFSRVANYKHLLSAYNVPGTVLNYLHVTNHNILTWVLWGRISYHHYFWRPGGPEKGNDFSRSSDPLPPEPTLIYTGPIIMCKWIENYLVKALGRHPNNSVWPPPFLPNPSEGPKRHVPTARPDKGTFHGQVGLSRLP